MKTGKIGAIFLISILALAGIGMGVASWTDTITIDGTVNTGDVDLVVVSYSGEWIWKCPSTEELIPTVTNEPPCIDAILVSSAFAEQAMEADGITPIDDAVTVTFDNLFPLVDFLYADVLLHYVGSIPVKVDEISLELTSSDPLFDHLETVIKIYRTDPTGTDVGELVVRGTQLHNCHYIKVIIGVRVPQLDETMDLDGSITGKINVIQWNDF